MTRLDSASYEAASVYFPGLDAACVKLHLPRYDIGKDAAVRHAMRLLGAAGGKGRNERHGGTGTPLMDRGTAQGPVSQLEEKPRGAWGLRHRRPRHAVPCFRVSAGWDGHGE